VPREKLVNYGLQVGKEKRRLGDCRGKEKIEIYESSEMRRGNCQNRRGLSQKWFKVLSIGNLLPRPSQFRWERKRESKPTEEKRKGRKGRREKTGGEGKRKKEKKKKRRKKRGGYQEKRKKGRKKKKKGEREGGGGEKKKEEKRGRGVKKGKKLRSGKGSTHSNYARGKTKRGSP